MLDVMLVGPEGEIQYDAHDEAEHQHAMPCTFKARVWRKWLNV